MLDFDEYGDAIADAWMVMRDHANRVGQHASVPTCPGWTVRDLIAHQGMVHRWAASTIRGFNLDTEAVHAEGMSVRDQLEWLDLGARDLLQALADAPADLEAGFFLHNAPPARLAWARRQAHETTIHAFDAMSASNGVAPAAALTWIKPRLAADGIDELLTGFLPRPRNTVRSSSPITVLVDTTDTAHAWGLRISDEPVVATRGAGENPDAALRGTVVGLYLALWNRSDEIEAVGQDVLGLWREKFRVAWS